MGLFEVRRDADAVAEATPSKVRQVISRGASKMNKPRVIDYRAGDEISYAAPAGMWYGTVKRVSGAGESGAIEIEWEDGRKEIKPVKDKAIALLRRASGASEIDEKRGDRRRYSDTDIESVRRSEQRKRW